MGRCDLWRGLPLCGQKIWQLVFYAREDTKRPFQYALVAMAVNAGLAIGLAFLIGYQRWFWRPLVSAWVSVTNSLWR